MANNNKVFKNWIKATAVLIAGVVVFGVLSWATSGFKSWGIGSGLTSDEQPDKPDDSYGGNAADEDKTPILGGSELSQVIDNGITLYSAVLPRAAYAANGVSELAENAFTLTAEVIPNYASNKLLNWSVAWQNSNSEWAKGKRVTDYVTITTPTDGAATAVCACLKDFGEPVVLTVSSRSNPEVNGVCSVQYYQRVKSCDLAFYYDDEQISVNSSNGIYKVDYTGAEKDYTVELVPVYSAYTLKDTYTTSIDGVLTSTFGYTTMSKLNSLTIPAGLLGGEQEMSSNLSLWCTYMHSVYSVKNPADSQLEGINRSIEYYLSSTVTSKFTAADKQHPRYLWYMNAINTLTSGNHFIYTSYNGAVGAQMDKYVPAAYRYCNAEIGAYNDFVSAVKKCNTAGVGVIQYTVKIDGNHSSYETVLNFSYNDDFKVNVQDIKLSDTQIAF